MEMTAIDASSEEEEEAITLRRDFSTWRGRGGGGEGDYEDNGD